MEEAQQRLLQPVFGRNSEKTIAELKGGWGIHSVMEYLATRKGEAEAAGLPTTSQALERLRLQQPAVQNTEDLALETTYLGPVAQWYVGVKGLSLNLEASEKDASCSSGQVDNAKEEISSSGTQFVMECHALLLPVGASGDSAAFYTPGMCTTLLENNWPLVYPYLLPTMFRSVAANTTTITALSYVDWKRLRTDPSMMDRFHYSYNVLLHYLGWRLHDQTTGELDRHTYWQLRYTALEKEFHEVNATLQDEANTNRSSVASEAENLLNNTKPGGYLVVAPLFRTLVELRLISYAKGLLKYILQEFVKGRLEFLRPLWINVWLPFVEHVEEEKSELNAKIQKELTRMKQRFAKLDQSDSD